jgi:hypothetical protein
MATYVILIKEFEDTERAIYNFDQLKIEWEKLNLIKRMRYFQNLNLCQIQPKDIHL